MCFRVQHASQLTEEREKAMSSRTELTQKLEAERKELEKELRGQVSRHWTDIGHTLD